VRLSALSNQVTLYKVLGGGWNETTPVNAVAPDVTPERAAGEPAPPAP